MSSETHSNKTYYRLFLDRYAGRATSILMWLKVFKIFSSMLSTEEHLFGVRLGAALDTQAWRKCAGMICLFRMTYIPDTKSYLTLNNTQVWPRQLQMICVRKLENPWRDNTNGHMTVEATSEMFFYLRTKRSFNWKFNFLKIEVNW